ncbi:MAG: fluoride efflux transporter CrcB [Bacteroidia bacterium]|nr:fluoride efflux transporter CrcB [Bacteroidia bacterium]MCC6768819.1 fluoride efflux transporter CrcB [Bacteroidia bacterium]
MKELIVVFIGSGLGGLSRFALGRWVDNWHTQPFPFGTFVVNLLACFLFGFIVGLADTKQILPPTAKLFMTVGFCGGFSTFSSFSSEALSLFQSNYNFALLLYVVGSVVLCITATFGGMLLAERM